MCTGLRGSSKLPRIGCTAVVGANGQPPGADGAVKQRVSTLRSVNRGSSGGRRGPAGFVVGGGSVVVGSPGAGSPVAAGVVVAAGVEYGACAVARRCFAGLLVDGEVSASGFVFPDAGPDTEYCHSQRGWWTRGGWLRNALARDGDATTTPAASEAVQRTVRAMIRVIDG
jgi:hypothetical protein